MTEENEFTRVGKGSEPPIETAIRRFLQAEGWAFAPRAQHGVDIEATKHGETLLVEVKGNTRDSSGTDTDTLYGQILRRASAPSVQLALGYPVAIRPKIDRVPPWMQAHLKLVFFEVDETGDVTRRSPAF